MDQFLFDEIPLPNVEFNYESLFGALLVAPELNIVR